MKIRLKIRKIVGVKTEDVHGNGTSGGDAATAIERRERPGVPAIALDLPAEGTLKRTLILCWPDPENRHVVVVGKLRLQGW